MNEDKEYYVSLELAQHLKDAGFDWPVRSFYQEPKPGSSLDKIFRENPKEHHAGMRHDMPFDKEDWNHREAYDRIYYSCPTLAVVQRWLREEKSLHVEAQFARAARFRDFVVVYIEDRIDGFAGPLEQRGWQSYESAMEFGISHALESLDIPF